MENCRNFDNFDLQTKKTVAYDVRMALSPILPLLVLQTHGMKLVFDQTFTHRSPSLTANWIFDDGPVYNDEEEKYASKPGPNVSIKDGRLVITGRYEKGIYTSGRLQSKKAWKYGYFECRARLPKGRGTWPAFWMLGDSLRKSKKDGNIGWPQCGEIDIMEQVGFEPDKIHCSLHSGAVNWMRKEQRTFTVDLPKATEGFHNYGLDWTPSHLDFYLDGKRVGGFEKPKGASFDNWPFDAPFFMILNLAIGGFWGGAKGIDPTIFPCSYEIEYVRIYQKVEATSKGRR